MNEPKPIKIGFSQLSTFLKVLAVFTVVQMAMVILSFMIAFYNGLVAT